MTTSRHTRCQFRVKETTGDPIIAVEPSGTEPVRVDAHPVDSLWFCLRPGMSVDEAQQVADIMNANLLLLGTAQRGDVEDITREAKHGERRQEQAKEKWLAVLDELKRDLLAEDFSAALGSLKAVESWGTWILYEWAQTLKQLWPI